MPSSVASAPASLCSSCRFTLLRTFLASAGAEGRRVPSRQSFVREYHYDRTLSGPERGMRAKRSVTSSTDRHLPLDFIHKRSFASLTANKVEADPFTTTPAQAATLQPPADESAASASREESTPSAYVPWYLQHQANEPKPAQHVAAGQEPPDLPEHAPELLQPVVTHVLDTLGLTHLRILDLRRMTDPPPALGANLLMVVATARSERHLHASADKLCRWLRTEYHLSPFADGLLGRNEMKIAIRRRVRRAKLMSAVGAKNGNDGDIADGLRSDWICVNIGRVEGGVLPDMLDAANDRDIIGFSTTNTTSALVVQMMTEDKRVEIDLEGLWLEALRRQNSKRERLGGSPTPQPELLEAVWKEQEHPKASSETVDTPYRPFERKPGDAFSAVV